MRFTTIDDPGDHLLERPILLYADRRPGPHVRLILREQGMHETHELASSEDEGTLCWGLEASLYPRR
jgi:hypothetical protein